MRVILTFWCLIFINRQINCFNISPKASVIYNKPSDNKIDSISKSTYFGFSLLLRKKSIMIGAPRANSTYNNNEPGLLYNCSIKENNICDIFNIENETKSTTIVDDRVYYKNKQWLTATIAGENLFTEKNPLMVCAPRVTATQHIFMTGMCYFMKDDNDISKKIIKNINDDKELSENKHTHTSTMYELGVSSYWIKQTQEFLLGIPSYNDSRGGLMRYNSISGNLKKLGKILGSNVSIESFTGFAVAAGVFDKSGNISYIVSAPGLNELNGAVFVIDKNQFVNGKYKYRLQGSQSFEYFGYSVIAEDCNRDGFSDIIVSSPFYTENNYFEIGAIYVYYGSNLKDGLNELKVPTITCPSKTLRARFGLSLAVLGDINLDGYNDIAVGAPNEGKGKVYLFGGSEHGLIVKPIQILEAPSFPNLFQPYNFGYSISSGIDIDENGVNDIAISAINIDKVFLFKAYPIINVTIFLNNFPDSILSDNKSFKFDSCIHYESLKSTFMEAINFSLYLKTDTNDNRLKFDNNLGQKNYTLTANHNVTECREQIIFVNMTTNDNNKTFLIEFGYEHIQNNCTENFMEKCAKISSKNKRQTSQTFFIKHLCGNKTNCISDLKISISKSHRNVIILDELKELEVHFTITNYKDPAYKPQVNITTNQNLPIIQYPSECSVKIFGLECVLCNKEIVLKNNKTKNLTIKFDTSNLKGSELKINANVFSSSDESNPKDNVDNVSFEIIACSIIQITEISPPGSQFQMLYENKHEMFEFNKTFEVKNVGSSTLSNLIFNILYPALLTVNSSKILSPLQPQKEIYFTDNSQNQIEIYNNYSLSTNNFSSFNERKDLPESCIITKQLIENIYSKTIKNITSDAKILFNINEIENNKKRNEGNNELKITTFFIKELSMDSQNTLRILINFKINQTYLWNLLEKFQKKFFIYEIKFSVDSLNCRNISMNCTQSYFGFRASIFETLFQLVPNQKIEIWIYISSFVLGIVVYFLIAFIMYKLGFFKRKKHEEVKDFKRQSLMRRSMRITAIPELDEIIEHEKKSDENNETAVAEDNL